MRGRPQRQHRPCCHQRRRVMISSSILLLVAIVSIVPIIFATSSRREDFIRSSSSSSSSSFNKDTGSNRLTPTLLHILGGSERQPQDESTKETETPTRTDEENSKNVQYKTIQVHIIHRHGDRTPITPLNNDEYWQSTLIPKDLLDKVGQGTNVIHHIDEQQKSIPSSNHIAKGRGPYGKLTQIGLLQMIDIGTRLKEELEQHTIWSSNIKGVSPEDGKLRISSDCIQVYSTDFDRTIQSVQGILVGFFPDQNQGDKIIDIYCQHTTSWMIPDPQPRRTHEQELLEIELANRPHILEREKEMKPLAIRCTRALLPLLAEDAFQVSYGVGEESTNKDDGGDTTRKHSQRSLSWAQLSEITNCLKLRNMLPKQISFDDQHLLSEYCAWKWFESLRHPRLAYLSMHHFTYTILDHMKKPILNDESPQHEKPIILYSCHDSSLIGLLCAFHLEQPSVWPEYGTVLKIELLEKITTTTTKDDNNNKIRQEEPDYVVRFYINGELLRSMWYGTLRNEISLKKLSHYINTVGAVKA